MNILLNDWAKKKFTPPPRPGALRSMRKTGQIKPAPVKVGRSWYVDENARFITVELEAVPIPENVSDRVKVILGIE